MLKNGFILRQVADVWAVLPTAADVLSFDGMLTLNDSGAFLWKALEDGVNKESLTTVLMDEYDVDLQTAEADIDKFLDKLREVGCLVE